MSQAHALIKPTNQAIKCWIYVPVADADINEQAEKWYESQAVRWFGVKGFKKEYEIIKNQLAFAEYVGGQPSAKKHLEKVNENDVLYVYCHGFIDKETKKPTGEIGGSALVNRKHTEARLSPAQLVDHLEKAGLKPSHRKLKLFSCYSSEVVKEISILMKDKWPNIEVHGYKHETIPAGPGHSKIAGLSYEDAKKYKQFDEEIALRINQGEFKAKKYRVEYIKGVLQEKNIDLDEKKAADTSVKTDKTDKTDKVVEEFSKLKL